MPYLGNVPSSFNIGTDNINNDAITTAKIADGAILNADVNAAAAIAGTKISPDFGSQNILTTGTATAASLIPTSSTAPTNGLYLPAANSIAISTGGTERLRVNSGGLLGLATSNPQTLLSLLGGYQISWNHATDGTKYAEIYADTSSNLIFRNTNSQVERMRLDSSGRLGVGTSSPNTKLTLISNTGALADNAIRVNGTANTQSSNSGLWITGNQSTSHYNWLIGSQYNVNGAFEITPSTAVDGATFSTPAVVVTSAGRVGIGTTSPTTPIHIKGDDGIKLENVSLSRTWGILPYTGGGSPNANFRIYDHTAGADRLNIDTSGRVGIGTTSPAVKLDVNGDIFASGGDIYTGANRMLSSDSTIRPLIFGIGAGEKARIDSSGRLLVGTSTGDAKFVVIETDNSSTGDAVKRVVSAGPSATWLSSNSPQVFGGGAAEYQFRNGSTARPAIISLGGDLNTSEALGVINFFRSGNSDGYRSRAMIASTVTNTGTANQHGGDLRFYTANDGSMGPTERMRILNNNATFIYGVYSQTGAVAANVVVGSDGNLYRSTSSIKYKTNVETIEDSYSDALLQCRPVWYRSTCKLDNSAHGFWGFIAEEVAEIDPRLVQWKTVEITYDEKGSAVETPLETPEPEGVQYDRFVPHLLNLIKRQKEQIEAMEARLTALESA